MASLMDLIVRIMGDGSNLRDDIDKDKAKVDELNAQKIDDKNLKIDADTEEATAEIDKLRAMIHDEKFSVDADDGQAETKLDFIKQTLESIKETTAMIEVSDPEAQKQLDSLKRKLDTMARTTLLLQLDDPFVDEKLAKLNTDIDNLKRKFARIPISVEDGSAEEKIQAIKMDLDSLHDKSFKVDADTAEAEAKLEKLKAEEDSVSRDHSGMAMGGGGNLLGPSVALAAPLASPVGASLLGGLMGLASAFTAATAGSVAFGAVAIPTITKVVTAANKGGTALKGLNDQQKQAVASVKEFESTWNWLADMFQRPVLSAFSSGLMVLQTLMVNLVPTIQGAASAVNGLLSDLQKSFGTPPVQAFFDYLGKMAGPMITAFGKIFGNTMLGVMNLMVAFGPLATQMMNGLVRMTQGFAQWSANVSKTQGFKDFIAYVRQTGPVLMSTIGNIVRIIGNLLVSLAPLGAAMLRVVQAITQFIARITQSHTAIGQLVAMLIPAVGAFKLLQSAMGLIPANVQRMIGSFLRARVIPTILSLIRTGFTTMLGPWGILIAAVVTGVALLITHWNQVSQWVQKNFGISFPQILRGLQQIFSQVWDAIRNAVMAAWNYIEPTIMNGVRSVMSFWNQAWPLIKQVFTEVWTEIRPIVQSVFAIWQGEFQVFFGVIRAIWGPFWSTIGSVLKTAWDLMSGVIRIAWDIIKGVVLTGLDSLTGHWGAAWNNIKSMFSNAWNDIKGTMGNLIGDAFNFGANFVHMIANGITGAIGSVISAVSGVAGKIKSFLGFHSPTPEGPGSEANVWMPNMMKMFTRGITAGIPALQGALSRAITPPTSVINPNVSRLVNGTIGGISTTGASAASAAGGSFVVQGPLVKVEHMDAHNQQDIQYLQQQLYNAEASVRRAKGVKGV